MTIISVIGAGVMGTAVTYPAADNGNEIRLVGTHLDDSIIQSCKDTGVHPRLSRPISTSVQTFFHTEIEAGMRDAEIVVIGVSSRGVHWAAQAIAPNLRPGMIILMVTKGLESSESGELQILPDVLRSLLPVSIRDHVHYAAIGGPSIAGELAAKRHTAVVFVSRDAAILPSLRAAFTTPYYHIWTSTDLIGVEVCVALKNPYALAVGLASGLLESQPPDVANAKMYNYAAAIFAQGLAETAYMIKVLGGNPETVFSLPGAGDLYVTTQGGRNSRMGRMLGTGMSFSDAVEEMPNETIEGVDTVIAMMPAIDAMTYIGSIDASALPLLRGLYQIVTRNHSVDFDFETFFSNLTFVQPNTGHA